MLVPLYGTVWIICQVCSAPRASPLDFALVFLAKTTPFTSAISLCNSSRFSLDPSAQSAEVSHYCFMWYPRIDCTSPHLSSLNWSGPCTAEDLNWFPLWKVRNSQRSLSKLCSLSAIDRSVHSQTRLRFWCLFLRFLEYGVEDAARRCFISFWYW